MIVERSRTTRSIVSPTRAPGGASSASTSTSAADSSAGVTTSSRMPRAAAAAIASSASPDVSLPSESSTIRCCVPAGKIAAASRTAAPTSVAPATGADAGSDSSSSSDGRRSTSALAPKTTTPAVSPSGISRDRGARPVDEVLAGRVEHRGRCVEQEDDAQPIRRQREAHPRQRQDEARGQHEPDDERRDPPPARQRPRRRQPADDDDRHRPARPATARSGRLKLSGRLIARARRAAAGRRPNARARVRRVGRWKRIHSTASSARAARASGHHHSARVGWPRTAVVGRHAAHVDDALRVAGCHVGLVGAEQVHRGRAEQRLPSSSASSLTARTSRRPTASAPGIVSSASTRRLDHLDVAVPGSRRRRWSRR